MYQFARVCLSATYTVNTTPSLTWLMGEQDIVDVQALHGQPAHDNRGSLSINPAALAACKRVRGGKGTSDLRHPSVPSLGQRTPPSGIRLRFPRPHHKVTAIVRAQSYKASCSSPLPPTSPTFPSEHLLRSRVTPHCNLPRACNHRGPRYTNARTPNLTLHHPTPTPST